MELVLLKSFPRMNASFSGTVHSPVQALYVVLASVSTTWRTIARKRQLFTRKLLPQWHNVGQYVTLDFIFVIMVKYMSIRMLKHV